MEDPAWYLVGTHRGLPCAAVVRPSTTTHGWRCRSTARDALQHDYPLIPLDEVLEWMKRDLRRIRCCTTDRQEALEHLAALHASGDAYPMGFLSPDPSLALPDADRRVLDHLETGW